MLQKKNWGALYFRLFWLTCKISRARIAMEPFTYLLTDPASYLSPYHVISEGRLYTPSHSHSLSHLDTSGSEKNKKKTAQFHNIFIRRCTHPQLLSLSVL